MSTSVQTLSFDAPQRSSLLDALHTYLQETKGYLRSYNHLSTDPGPLDMCCDEHLARWGEQPHRRNLLLQREQQIHDLIEQIDDPHSPSRKSHD